MVSSIGILQTEILHSTETRALAQSLHRSPKESTTRMLWLHHRGSTPSLYTGRVDRRGVDLQGAMFNLCSSNTKGSQHGKYKTMKMVLPRVA